MSATLLPPHSIDAEMSVLGSIMLSPPLMSRMIGSLAAADFYQPRAQATYAAMVELFETGQPIDIVTVSQALAGQVELPWLIDTQNSTPSLSSAPRHAQIIIEHSRRRRVIALASDIQEQAYQVGNDIEDVVAMLDPSTDSAILPREQTISGLWDIREWTERTELIAERRPWLVPHIIRPRWRVIMVAGEGVGKATLMRQIGLHAAAGIDPWDPSKRIEPIDVLYVDVENADTTILRQDKLANRSLDLVKMTNGHFHLWHQEGGLDLRQRTVRAKFEAVLQQVRPKLVLAGPMYKLFRRDKSEPEDQAATDFVSIIDDLRVRYDFAIILEHHAPKGDAKSMRDITAFGSSVFLRWPEFGIALNDNGQAKWIHDSTEPLVVNVERFRPDREPADWPTTITRGNLGSNLAWAPMFEHGRGRKVGGKHVDGEWTYSEVP